jgi:hypothetical protein
MAKYVCADALKDRSIKVLRAEHEIIMQCGRRAERATTLPHFLLLLMPSCLSCIHYISTFSAEKTRASKSVWLKMSFVFLGGHSKEASFS